MMSTIESISGDRSDHYSKAGCGAPTFHWRSDSQPPRPSRAKRINNFCRDG